MIKEFWDIFAPEGIKRYMHGFEFAIDTGSHTPICCKKPTYGQNESKIILKAMDELKKLGWITKCSTGGWASPIVLAPKPHQEHVDTIKDFIWRMCISYRNLNRKTNSFQFPITWCNSAIE